MNYVHELNSRMLYFYYEKNVSSFFLSLSYHKKEGAVKFQAYYAIIVYLKVINKFKERLWHTNGFNDLKTVKVFITIALI